MEFSAQAQLNKRKEADALVLPFWEVGQQKKPKAAASYNAFISITTPPINLGDFTGKEGEVLAIYPHEKNVEKKILLLGLGKQEGITEERFRGSFSQVARHAILKKIRSLNLVLPNVAELRGISLEESLRAISEGIALVNYKWDRFLSKDNTFLLEKVNFIGILPKNLEVLNQTEKLVEGVFLARDLINGNADEVTPEYLGKVALALEKKFSGIKTHVYDKEWIAKEKMDLFLGVGKGATHDPYFIVVKYQGQPRSKDHTVIVGKGITYDTGGLNLKPTGSMETMRADMSGAAAVLGTIAAIAGLKLKVNVTAVIATCENAIDGKSYKPGDVYTGYSGKSVEIANTDAEGRLTLADALAYSIDKLAPTRIIDLATLTGAITVALGDDIAGLMSNDDKLSAELQKASEKTGEAIWRMPLYLDYLEQIKTDIADLKNSGGRLGGAITAALFLNEFVGKTPWAHLDIAGTAFATKEKDYNPKNGVGWGVRLLVAFLKELSA